MKASGSIWIPFLLACTVLVQSVGLGIQHRSRTLSTPLMAVFRDTTPESPDTLLPPSQADSLLRKGLPEEEDTTLFGFEVIDTIPFIPARDTMHVPDSLRLTDPFLFRYYVAVKDSLTHRIVVDSLLSSHLALRDSARATMERGDTLSSLDYFRLSRLDSLDGHRVDSLYLADSTETAIRRFNAWYSSLSKKERRKYEYEKALPAKLHRMDSILAVKDSLRAIRDSIRQNTPRILSTYAVPDSMYYKRIFTWTHDPSFNKIYTKDLDTSYNHYFYDEPFFREDVNVSYLGVIGTAVQPFDFTKRKSSSGVSFYTPYEVYTYSPETLPMYNTKTPYTELSYHGTIFANKEKEEDNIRIFTTQNILPSLNFTLEYKRYGSGGMLLNENTFNKTVVASANYLGENYLAHGGYIYNRIKHSENGGMQETRWIRDTTVDAREIDVHLLKAENLTTRHTFFFNQSYRVPLSLLDDLRERRTLKAEQALREAVLAQGDSTAIDAMEDSLARVTAARAEARAIADSIRAERGGAAFFIGTSSEYSTFRKVYTDHITDDGGRQFYHNTFYLDPAVSYDSLRVMKLDNKIYVRLQPWSDRAVVSKIEGGVGDKLLSHYLFTPKSYLQSPGNVNWNTFYAYAGAEGHISDAVWWQGFGQMGLAGEEAGDMILRADAGLRFYPFRRARKSPVSFQAGFASTLQRPDFYAEHFFSNHYKWDNDFDKTSRTEVTAALDIPRWDLNVKAGYSLVTGHIYYDTLGIVRQHGGPVSVLSLSLKKNFTLLNFFHFDHQALFQLSSEPDVIPLPAAALNCRYYIQFPIVRNVLNFQFGANAWYNSPWYAPGYNPVAGTFTLQKREKYGDCPYFDIFINAQWKRACIWLKIGNAGLGWPMDHPDYFSAHGYIRPGQTFKIGLHWPFYTQPGRNESVSGKASSGMGGGGGGGRGGGLGGGLGSALGGLKASNR